MLSDGRLTGATSMRVKTDPDLVSKYQAALAEVERLEAIPRDERGEEGYRAALLARAAPSWTSLILAIASNRTLRLIALPRDRRPAFEGRLPEAFREGTQVGRRSGSGYGDVGRSGRP
jgi:hypothetical protein